MRRVSIYLLVAVFLLLFQQPSHTHAAEILNNRNDVMDFLEKSFYAQVSLSEKPREMEEITTILKPYFTDDYIELFLQENLVEDNGKFLTYGSDFAPFYIPFFQFSEVTEVSIEDDAVYIYEYFEESTDGPVTYKGHYEGILIEKINEEWKISNMLHHEEVENYLEKQQSELEQLVYNSGEFWMEYVYLLSTFSEDITLNNDPVMDKRQQTIRSSEISPFYY